MTLPDRYALELAISVFAKQPINLNRLTCTARIIVLIWVFVILSECAQKPVLNYVFHSNENFVLQG